MNSHGCRKRISGGLLLFVLAMALSCSAALFFNVKPVSAAVFVPYGEVNVTVFVVSLEGVEGPAGVSASRLIDGISEALTGRYVIDRGIVWDLSGEPLTLAQVKFNVTFTVVREWEAYRNVVESGVGVIVVNAHGETLPVPAGYSKESWVDRIAEAMARRNVTWVHVAGYPLWRCSFEGGGEADWGVDGFKRLMGHIGKANVACSHPEADPVGLSADADWSVALTWVRLPAGTEYGTALYGPDFEDCLLMSMYGEKEWFVMGATVRFGEAG